MTTTAARTRLGNSRRPGPPRSGDAVLGRVLDAVVEVGVVAFAGWTLLYHAAIVLDLRPSAILIVWIAVTTALVALRATRRGRRASPVLGGARNGPAAIVALGVAVLASFLVRPDLDDASYVVRSTWVAERDDLGTGDILFSHGRWSALVGQDPYLPSFETLLGALARLTGISAGSVVYLVWVPLATFAAIWSLWMMLRAWRLRSPLAGLALAVVLLLWGGAVHASWGNLHLGRIWQGKVVLLAVLVPATYAWCAAYWRSTPGPRRRRALALVGASAVAAVGLSPAGVFVLPGVAVVGAVAGAAARRPGRAVALAAVGCAYPLAAGVVTRFVGNVGDAAATVGPAINPWTRTLGTGVPAVVVAVAGAVALLGALLPRWSGIRSPIGRVTAAASVLVAVLIGVPPVYDVISGLMGTDAIAWRAVWVVPVPALVAALASVVPWRRAPGVLAGLVAAAALVVGGQPLWSGSNGAELVRTPRWKMHTYDLTTARWIVDEAPRAGRYLARTGVVAAVGTMTTELETVGSRWDYLVHYTDLPDAQVEARTALQVWADGSPGTADPQVLAGYLDALDVHVACAVGDRQAELGAGWTPAATTELDTCWVRR